VDPGPAFQGLIDAQIAVMGHEASRALGGEPQTELSPRLREFLREGANVTPERLRSAREPYLRSFTILFSRNKERGA